MSVSQAKVVVAVAFGCLHRAEVQELCNVASGTVGRCFQQLKRERVLVLQEFRTKLGRWSIWYMCDRAKLERLFDRACDVLVDKLGKAKASEELHRIGRREVEENGE